MEGGPDSAALIVGCRTVLLVLLLQPAPHRLPFPWPYATLQTLPATMQRSA